jgi:UDP-N-acetyl-D-galactosamine dehydrogenase
LERVEIMNNIKICIVGLGYVGIQLASEFGKYVTVYGFDVNKNKLEQYKNGIDETKSVSADLLKNIKFVSNIPTKCNVFIICVPTPITQNNEPDYQYVISATYDVANKLKKSDIVIYESTVGPGATRNKCIPILEKISKLKVNNDFGVGFSPERLQPGKNGKKIKDIVKLVSGSNNSYCEEIRQLYSIILGEKVKKCSSLEVAEMSKIMENVKRDVNIALMNEFAKLCHDYNIDTMEVIESARTKFNFNNSKYQPGLVGGHCIGVDPYYLKPSIKSFVNMEDIILKARGLNESVIGFIGDEIIKQLPKKNETILLMGITFKENCNDVRNSKAVELYRFLLTCGYNVLVYDDVCNENELNYIYSNSISLINEIPENVDAVVIAVKHDSFKKKKNSIEAILKKCKLLFDIKRLFDKETFNIEGLKIWNL